MHDRQLSVTSTDEVVDGGHAPGAWTRRTMLSLLAAAAAAGVPASTRPALAAPADLPDWRESVVTGELMVDGAPAPQWAGHRIKFGRALKQPVRVFVTVHNSDDRNRNASVRNITATGAEVGLWRSSGSSNRLVQWLAVGADSPFLSGAVVLRPRADGSAYARQPWGTHLRRESVPHVIATGVSGSDELVNVAIEPRLINRWQVGVGLHGTARDSTLVQWLGVRESLSIDQLAAGRATIMAQPQVFNGVDIDFGRRLPSPVRVFVTASDARGSVLNAAASDIGETGAVVGIIGSADVSPEEEISVDWVALGGTDVPYSAGSPFAGHVIAHRGRNSRVPENLIGSLDGLDPWVDGVEFDARLTADGVAVVMHDAAVDRTTDGTGEVADLTLREIKALNASGETVPTVAEYLRACEGRGFSRILIDMKVESVAAMQAVVEAVDASPLKDICVFLSSAARRSDGPDGGESLRSVSTTARLGSLGGNIDNIDEVLAWSERHAGELILLMPNTYLTHRSTVPLIKAAGLEPASSTINDESSLRVAREDEVALILTDTSDRLEGY